MSPTLSGSIALQRIKLADVLEICNGIILEFNPGLPHVQFLPGTATMLTDPGAKKQVVLMWLSYLAAVFFAIVSIVLGSFSSFSQL